MSEQDSTNLKTCTKCRLAQHQSHFNKRSASKDGLQPVCRACYSGYHSLYLVVAKDKRREYHQAWTEANREHVNANGRQWRAKNKELDKAHKKTWADANPENRRARNATRRARKQAAVGKYTQHDIEQLKFRQRTRCTACGKKLDKFHVDHIVPLAKGGTNNPQNLQLLCPPCNLSKSKRDPVEFMQSRGFLC